MATPMCEHTPVRGVYFHPMYQAAEFWKGEPNWFFYKESVIPTECISGGKLFICRKCWLVYAEPTRAMIVDGEWQEMMDIIDDKDGE